MPPLKVSMLINPYKQKSH